MSACKHAAARPAQEARSGFLLLAGANFAVALGYGIVLPFVPWLVERVSGPASLAVHAVHTGALLGIYPLALFVAAPLWGRLADRCGARAILLGGLAVYALALGALAFAPSLKAAYLLRATAGVAAGAVLPLVASAFASVAELRRRARLFAGASVATLLGLLAGPALSGAAYALGSRFGAAQASAAFVHIGAAGLAVMLVCLMVSRLPACALPPATRAATRRPDWRAAGPYLMGAFAVLLGLGAFEAMLPLIGQQQLPFGAAVLGALLAGCMLAMLAVQSVLFATPVLHHHARAGALAGAFIAMALGTLLLSAAASLPVAAAGVLLIGAGAAFLQPALAYLASLNSGEAPGAVLGALTAAGSIGQAAGAFLGAALFGWIEARALWLLAALLLLGAWGSAAGLRRVPAGAH